MTPKAPSFSNVLRSSVKYSASQAAGSSFQMTTDLESWRAPFYWRQMESSLPVPCEIWGSEGEWSLTQGLEW